MTPSEVNSQSNTEAESANTDPESEPGNGGSQHPRKLLAGRESRRAHGAALNPDKALVEFLKGIDETEVFAKLDEELDVNQLISDSLGFVVPFAAFLGPDWAGEAFVEAVLAGLEAAGLDDSDGYELLVRHQPRIEALIQDLLT